MLPRVLTHAIDEEVDLYLAQGPLSRSFFSDSLTGHEECRRTGSLNLLEIALQTPPPTMLNPLHIYAIQGKTKLLNMVRTPWACSVRALY